MLEIKPLQSKQLQHDMCGMCGVEYNEDYLCYGAFSDDKAVGVCQFYLTDGCGYIDDIKCASGVSDEDALFLLGRATLNFIDLCGVHTAVFTKPYDALARRIGFTERDGEYTVDLVGFFENPCKNS